ncbi:PREDICTED: CD151 antigen-like [Cyprinodon variegatus]|uniref:CD151 antigen-like n=1 Tax=Cyprinodon variegatus TaxID=28743 RepID=UPI000742852B|nr:PREDICTED: CD151 antigen-like [Cyprinodon variegatus]
MGADVSSPLCVWGGGYVSVRRFLLEAEFSSASATFKRSEQSWKDQARSHPPSSGLRMEANQKQKNSCGVICLKYLLFLFNICFWLGGGAMLAVGVWTLVENSDYISLLNSSFYSASAYILIAAGGVVIVTGMIGCCATLKERRSLLIVYLVLLLSIFLLEITAGILAYVNNQQVSLCFISIQGGCIEQLEHFLRSHLYILGAVGVGIAFLQLVGMMFTCCLCRNLKEDLY